MERQLPAGPPAGAMRVAVPNKGRLHEPAIDLLERAGLHVVDGGDRKLYADTVDEDVRLLFARAADIPEYVSDGAADLGITGYDQVRESGRDNVEEVLDLGYGRCRLVLAAPEDGDIDAVADLDGRTVATEFPRITREFFAERAVDPEVIEVSGATELTPHAGMADAIVDITSTGTTLAVNRLAVVEEVLASSARLFARSDVLDDPKTEQVRTALQSVLDAEGKRYLMMNVPEDRLDEVAEALPGMDAPTVMDIAGRESVAVHTVVDERDLYGVVDDVRKRGASDVLVTEIERLVE